MAEMVVAVTIMVIITALVAGLFTQVRKMVSLSQWMGETRTQIRATIDTLAADLQNLDTDAWFVLYCVDERQDATGSPPQIWPDVPGSVYTRWADRLAFVAAQPAFSLQADAAVQAWGGLSPPPGLEDFAGSAARIYYGYPDPNAGPSWARHTLVRRAVVHLWDRALEPPPAGAPLDDRRWWDHEFDMQPFPGFAAYTYDDVRRALQINPSAVLVNLLVAPPWMENPSASLDERVQQRELTARARVLLPDCYKIRFQVRLRDGTVWPRLLTRADLATLPVPSGARVFEGDMVASNLSDYAGAGVTAWAAWAGPTFHRDLGGQVADPSSAAGEAWPVALRVRIEVYDPQRRTPDPIVVDQWLPIRWRRQP